MGQDAPRLSVLLARFEALLDRMEDMLRRVGETGIAPPSGPVLEEHKQEIDKFIQRWKAAGFGREVEPAD